MTTQAPAAPRVRGETPRTMAEKVWADHVVAHGTGEGAAREPDLIYIDLHLVHEVTSPQAFDGLRLAGRPVRRPDLTIATEDHNVPTIDIDKPIADPVSRTQVETLRRNCEEFGIRLHPMGDAEQGIVHIIGPQLGLTQPGMTVVCGDSHTSTHGAFGALAMGIGTSEVEHVLATQTLPLRPFKTMAVNVDGQLPPGCQRQGHHPRGDREDRHRRRAGPRHRIPRQRHRIAVDGRPDDDLQHEHRGRRARRHGGARRDHVRIPARAVRTRRRAPTGMRRSRRGTSCALTRAPNSTPRSTSTPSTLSPFVTWGTNPGQGVPLSDSVPDPELMFDDDATPVRRKGVGVHGSSARNGDA